MLLIILMLVENSRCSQKLSNLLYIYIYIYQFKLRRYLIFADDSFKLTLIYYFLNIIVVLNRKSSEFLRFSSLDITTVMFLFTNYLTYFDDL